MLMGGGGGGSLSLKETDQKMRQGAWEVNFHGGSDTGSGGQGGLNPWSDIIDLNSLIILA